ncbi:hypothetical protein GWK47_002295 [Chionoecetes opilio]|uniref:Uncharacterized protein n=1 Tax=Chionoecetes opilio TaxID=41210 RepID=A0A8J5BW36_CHIOP|nr:hypothetical protein GWK47_002295 [Chionoecetes opilio]
MTSTIPLTHNAHRHRSHAKFTFFQRSTWGVHDPLVLPGSQGRHLYSITNNRTVGRASLQTVPGGKLGPGYLSRALFPGDDEAKWAQLPTAETTHVAAASTGAPTPPNSPA